MSSRNKRLIVYLSITSRSDAYAAVVPGVSHWKEGGVRQAVGPNVIDATDADAVVNSKWRIEMMVYELGNGVNVNVEVLTVEDEKHVVLHVRIPPVRK